MPKCSLAHIRPSADGAGKRSETAEAANRDTPHATTATGTVLPATERTSSSRAAAEPAIESSPPSLSSCACSRSTASAPCTSFTPAATSSKSNHDTDTSRAGSSKSTDVGGTRDAPGHWDIASIGDRQAWTNWYKRVLLGVVGHTHSLHGIAVPILAGNMRNAYRSGSKVPHLDFNRAMSARCRSDPSRAALSATLSSRFGATLAAASLSSSPLLAGASRPR
mmetsp:Transcript_1063/g.3607  ORF Transcript_1063/g.3607 Transcript_1063/m.3607 type:complete len:222 (+) Transcript_1063:1983-2648(+)